MLKEEKYDFSGWATRHNIKCSDGRTIRKEAFKHMDGKTVPLVWMHGHDDPTNVLGKAILHYDKEGVYALGKFNNTQEGQHAKILVEHGDIQSLSIHANKLKQNNGDVLHGNITEVSLVLSGANPGAYIDFPVLAHGEESTDEAIIYSGEELFEEEEMKKYFKHSEDQKPEENSSSERTVKDVFDEMTEEQKKVCMWMVGQALEEAGVDQDDEMGQSDDYEEDYMKRNIFDREDRYEMEKETLSHSERMEILEYAKKNGSLKEAVEEFLEHSETNGVAGTTYGIKDINILFPEAKTLQNEPDFIKRETAWVDKVLGGVKKVPFTRIKMVHANITEKEARAKGYVKGTKKVEEVFKLLKRVTSPTTIYKKQKLDRDDIIDITDFDIVQFMKKEMRMMLDEEIALAILLGDGRQISDGDKINEDNIRPIYKDDELYVIKKEVEGSTDSEKAKAFIDTIIRARKDYKGTGQPSLFTTADMVTEMILLKDGDGRDLYRTEEELRAKLRVKEIIEVEPMENVKNESKKPLLGILVNLEDYKVGTDKGGDINFFDDFDIDFNQQKYLMETRCSGSLTKPYSAIVIEGKVAVED